MDFRSGSDEETKKFASRQAQKYLKKGIVISLTGELGAGKTTFVQGFAEGLGIKDRIISPTFVLMRQHQVPNSEMVLYHIDLYRLEGDINIEEIGLRDLFNDSKAIVLIEWADKIKDLLPQNTSFINLKKLSKNERSIKINASSEDQNYKQEHRSKSDKFQ